MKRTSLAQNCADPAALPAPAGLSCPEPGRSASAKKILYAEDDAVLRTCAERFLRHSGYELVAVENGLQAWNALQSNEFSVLITDNDMPKLAGIELVTRLRRVGNQIPIILASGSAGFFSAEYGWLNFSACLQKPFDPAHLLASVRKAVQ